MERRASRTKAWVKAGIVLVTSWALSLPAVDVLSERPPEAEAAPPDAPPATVLTALVGRGDEGRGSRPGHAAAGPDAWDSGGTLADDPLWEARYAVYQGLMSGGSGALMLTDDGYVVGNDGTPLCLLHGRADVVENAAIIRGLAGLHPDIPPVMVAAAIAEQASDVERVFGVDALERTGLTLPGRENMSVGIAQIRPTEAISLGLGPADLFDPRVAVLGMYVKMQAGLDEIAAREDPAAPLPVTERMMLLALAQNSRGSVADYFAVEGDWARLLAMRNYARVMRYTVVHLDWLVSNGWTLPEGVDLAWWRRVAFSGMHAR